MVGSLRGRQTQFYIDVVYGLAFALGFGYLLLYGMDVRVAAFQGGLVLGYFLRVWENMTVYERILEDEIASKAESQVADELETQVPEQVEAEVSSAAEEHVADEVEAQVSDEVEAQVSSAAEEQVADEVEAQMTHSGKSPSQEEIQTELLGRLGEIDEDVANTLRDHLESTDESNDGGSTG